MVKRIGKDRRVRQQKVAARIVLVTCESHAQAEQIARSVVERHLAVCVNVLSAPVQSIYRWREQVETSSEFLLVIKTTEARLEELEQAVKALHSYEVPEFLAVAAAGGSAAYLNWMAKNI